VTADAVLAKRRSAMTKLTDSQLIVSSATAARDDGLAIVPAKMNKASASKVGLSLVARKLMREVKAKPGTPVWRRDDADRPISLVITKAGRAAIGVEKGDVAKKEATATLRTKAGRSGPGKRKSSGKGALRVEGVPMPRAGSKQALVVEMLRGETGATLQALVGATGWLPHTTRAALTGLRKRGISIERLREGDASIYRIAERATAPAAA
jgi:hypothetical protein